MYGLKPKINILYPRCKFNICYYYCYSCLVCPGLKSWTSHRRAPRRSSQSLSAGCRRQRRDTKTDWVNSLITSAGWTPHSSTPPSRHPSTQLINKFCSFRNPLPPQNKNPVKSKKLMERTQVYGNNILYPWCFIYCFTWTFKLESYSEKVKLSLRLCSPQEFEKVWGMV